MCRVTDRVWRTVSSVMGGRICCVCVAAFALFLLTDVYVYDAALSLPLPFPIGTGSLPEHLQHPHPPRPPWEHPCPWQNKPNPTFAQHPTTAAPTPPRSVCICIDQIGGLRHRLDSQTQLALNPLITTASARQSPHLPKQQKALPPLARSFQCVNSQCFTSFIPQILLDRPHSTRIAPFSTQGFMTTITNTARFPSLLAPLLAACREQDPPECRHRAVVARVVCCWGSGRWRVLRHFLDDKPSQLKVK